MVFKCNLGCPWRLISSKSKLPDSAPGPCFLPRWDSFREFSREIYQGVELLEPECILFCFNPFLGGLRVLPSLRVWAEAGLASETLCDPSKGLTLGNVFIDSYLRPVCLNDSKKGGTSYKEEDGGPTPSPCHPQSLSLFPSLNS